MAYIQSFKEQSWLLPPSIEDLIPEDHVCFLIDSIVDALDYSAFDIKYSGAGHPAYQSTLENYGLNLSSQDLWKFGAALGFIRCFIRTSHSSGQPQIRP